MKDTHELAADLRRHARKIGTPAGDTPSVMTMAADRLDATASELAALKAPSAPGDVRAALAGYAEWTGSPPVLTDAVELIDQQARRIADLEDKCCTLKELHDAAADERDALRARLAEIEAQAVPDETRAGRDVLAERRRQVSAKGYDHQHDDAHVCDEIAAAACFYAMPPGAREWDTSSTGYGDTLGDAIVPDGWVLSAGSRRRDLVKAGALILAEIERMDRAARAEEPEPGIDSITNRPKCCAQHVPAQLPDIELVSAKVHQAWMETKLAQGIHSRPAADGTEQMVPYESLPDALQELDRSTVRAVYAAIAQATAAPEHKA